MATLSDDDFFFGDSAEFILQTCDDLSCPVGDLGQVDEFLTNCDLQSDPAYRQEGDLQLRNIIALASADDFGHLVNTPFCIQGMRWENNVPCWTKKSQNTPKTRISGMNFYEHIRKLRVRPDYGFDIGRLMGMDDSDMTYILSEVFVLPVYKCGLATIEEIEIPNTSKYTHFVPFYKANDMKSADKVAKRLCGKGSKNTFVSLNKSKIKYTDWVYETGLAMKDRMEYIVVIAVERMRQNMMFGTGSRTEDDNAAPTPAQVKS